jgi:hypothetical protein
MDFLEQYADHPSYIQDFHDFLNEESIKTPVLDKLEDIKDKVEDRLQSRFEEIFKRVKKG